VPAAAASIALIANPASGSRDDRDELATELRRFGARVAVFGIDEAEAAAGSGAERVAVASGDGGIAPAAAAAGAAGVPLAVIPAGTANDFARAMELPGERAGAARLAVEGTVVRALELGRLGERPFVNAANAGLAAPAARTAAGLKRVLGPFAYLWGAVWAGLSERPLCCAVTADGRLLYEGGAWQLIVACSGSFGSGSELRPADPTDGLLDVAVIEAGSRRRLVAHAYGLRSGRLTEQRGVHHARAALVELDLAPGTGFNVDGELVDSGPVRVRAEPAAFELVVG
jgi:diacylglycerol kinase (ATP)